MAKVAVLMGSDTDLAVMKQAVDVLREFGIDYEVKILSAHRSPRETAAFAEGAEERGIKVIIAGAGAAAHLAGVLAAHTTLPVIGVPLASGALDGIDALYATVQMPRGVPVATVALNGAANAAILAVQMLALSDESLASKLKSYKAKLAQEVLDKNAQLASIGLEGYLLKKGAKK